MLKLLGIFAVTAFYGFALIMPQRSVAQALPQAQDQSRTVIVGSANELLQVLGDGRDRRKVGLKPGVYAQLTIENLPAGAPLVVTAADPSSPPIIRKLIVTGSSDLVLDGLSFAPAASSGDVLTIARSNRIEIRRARFGGSGDAAVDRSVRAVLVDEVDGLTVVDSRFSALERGLVLNRAKRVQITHNAFNGLGTGAVDLAASEDVEIAANRFSGFRADAARTSSFIRGFMPAGTVPTRNVRIVNNVMIQDTSTITDGVLFTNEGRIPYERIEILDNIMVISGPRGVTVERGSRVRIDNNVIIETEFGNHNAAIRMIRVNEGSMTGNLAAAFATVDSARIEQKFNSTVPRLDIRSRRVYLDRINRGLAGKGDGRIQARNFVTAAHRTSGPRT